MQMVSVQFGCSEANCTTQSRTSDGGCPVAELAPGTWNVEL